jgi:hypothetical protein
MAGGLLTKRALLLAKVQASSGVDANPDAANDAILVSGPDYTTDPQVLERDFVSNDLSKFEHIIGRVVAGFTFTAEVRGNGKQQSGLLADAPKFATLLRGCGFALSPMDGSGAQNLTDVIPAKANNSVTDVTWAKGGTVTADSPVLYTIECTTAGASGIAEVIVTGNNDTEDDLSAAVAGVITDGVPVPLGAKGGEVTPTITGSLSLGDKWQVMAFPTGIMAKPVSTGHEQITLDMYFDGLRHKGLDGMGTFSIDATAGEFASATFNFTTTFVDPVDVPMPTNPVYEDTLPPQVELSLLSWGGNTDMFAESWSFDAANDLQPRLDVNARQGYRGTRISDRAATGGFTPEAQLEADAEFWKDYLAGTSKTFTTRVGTERGNMVVLFAPNAQTTEQPYSDRNGLRTLDKSVSFKRGLNGDDEIIFVFC